MWNRGKYWVVSFTWKVKSRLKPGGEFNYNCSTILINKGNTKMEKMFICNCKSESLTISHDKEFKHYEISMWNRSIRWTGKMPFSERLRWCWKILFTGELWNDYMVVDETQAEEISKQFLSHKNRMILNERNVIGKNNN
jgi:hypothetical protein